MEAGGANGGSGMARAENARAVASMVKVKARAAAEAVMAMAVAKVAKMVEEWVEARVDVSAVEVEVGMGAWV